MSVYLCLVVTKPLGSRLWCLTVSLSLSLGQVWYLIVSIPDLCTLTYFYSWFENMVTLINELIIIDLQSIRRVVLQFGHKKARIDNH